MPKRKVDERLKVQKGEEGGGGGGGVVVLRPHPPPRRTKGTQDWTGTLYFLFQMLVGLSLITESKYHIQGYKNKTTTVVVFVVSIHTVPSPIYIYIYKNCKFTFTYSELGTYMW